MSLYGERLATCPDAFRVEGLGGKGTHPTLSDVGMPAKNKSKIELSAEQKAAQNSQALEIVKGLPGKLRTEGQYVEAVHGPAFAAFELLVNKGLEPRLTIAILRDVCIDQLCFEPFKASERIARVLPLVNCHFQKFDEARDRVLELLPWWLRKESEDRAAIATVFAARLIFSESPLMIKGCKERCLSEEVDGTICTRKEACRAFFRLYTMLKAGEAMPEILHLYWKAARAELAEVKGTLVRR